MRYLGGFHGGYAVVARYGISWNYVNSKGEYLLSEWMDYCEDFHEGYAAIKRDDKWNYVNDKGEYLLSEWAEDVSNFYKGTASVRRNGNWEEIDVKGEVIEARE